MDRNDLDTWHDVIVEVFIKLGIEFDYPLEDALILKYYDILPDEVKAIAEEWGMSDTVFRDTACEWLENFQV